MLKHLLTQRATILNPVPVAEDDYGDEVDAYTNTSGRTWACRVDPWKGQEFEVDRDTRKTWFRLFLSEHAAGQIDARSQVIVDDVLYECFGDPRVFRRRSRVSHVEVILRIIKG